MDQGGHRFDENRDHAAPLGLTVGRGTMSYKQVAPLELPHRELSFF